MVLKAIFLENYQDSNLTSNNLIGFESILYQSSYRCINNEELLKCKKSNKQL